MIMYKINILKEWVRDRESRCLNPKEIRGMKNEKISMEVLVKALEFSVPPATQKRILKAVRHLQELNDKLKKQEKNKAK